VNLTRIFFTLFGPVALLVACREQIQTPKSKEVTIQNLLQLTLPATYQFVKGKGVDSDVHYIITDKRDTIGVEYGHKGIIDNLYSVPVAVFPYSKREWVVKSLGREPTPDDVLFSEFPEDDNDQRIFEKNYFMYDTINNIVVKIVQPKRIGDGITGLNIPKLKDSMSLTIRGDNLDSSTHKALLDIFRTLRYK
jgi:hypothetical protein